MSITFSQTLRLIDKNCKSNTVSYPLLDKTEDINLALDKVMAKIFKASGRWQYDDNNHTDYPIIMTSLISGQRDYNFVNDENGNVILDVYRVMVKNEQGYYDEIYPVDQQSDEDMASFYDGRNTTGIPSRYDKTANGIFLDAIPSYNSTNGLKVFINREGSYFTISDTTKKAGFAGLFHEYLALEPSIRYCKRNKMFDLADRYQQDLDKMDIAIQQYYRDRSKDEIPIISGTPINPY